MLSLSAIAKSEKKQNEHGWCVCIAVGIADSDG